MNIKKYKEQTEDNIRMSKNRLSHRSEFNLIKTKINNILSTNCCKKINVKLHHFLNIIEISMFPYPKKNEMIFQKQMKIILI